MDGERKHGHAADRAYTFIKTAIIQEDWPDGTHLREIELAKQIGVSRTPVRDALRRLVAEGLVEMTTNVGCRVRSWTAADLDEIFGLRTQLEGYAARLAATAMGTDETEELMSLCQQMEAVVANSEEDRAKRELLAPLNERFHSLILYGSRSARLQRIMRQVVSVPLVLRTFTRYEAEEVRRSLGHHREMVDAFLARDPDWAESVMRSHIRAGHAVMKRSLARAQVLSGDRARRV